MEHLSDSQLRKYDKILNEISEQHQRNAELLKKIQELDGQLMAIGLISREHIITSKIFKAIVRVFDSTFHIYEAFQEKISLEYLEKLSRLRRCKFYVIVVYIDNDFQERFNHKNWILNVTVRNSKKVSCKSINLKTHVTYPICVVVPFVDDFEDASVDVNFSWKSEAMRWPSFKAASVPIDVSYHFQRTTTPKNHLARDLGKLNALYNEESKEVKPLKFTSRMRIEGTFKDFLRALTTRCLHRFVIPCPLIQHESSVRFSLDGFNEIFVKVDGTMMQMEATLDDMRLLKTFVLTNVPLKRLSPSVGEITVCSYPR